MLTFRNYSLFSNVCISFFTGTVTGLLITQSDMWKILGNILYFEWRIINEH